MVSFHKGHELVHSVSTLNSPNKGSRLFDKLVIAPQFYPLEKYDRVFALMGLSKTNAFEFITQNMGGFNMLAHDHPTVDYFSVGCKAERWAVDDRMKFTYDIMSSYEGGFKNDGMLYWEDTVWGNILQ